MRRADLLAADPRWTRPALVTLLVTTAVAYSYRLSASGWANEYYAAAVQAGSVSWKAFFYGASDAPGSITVDKPPLALWAMGLSARAFGLSAWSLLLPQVAMGVGTVGVLFAAVRRRAGAGAGLVAGAVVATTPVAVLMFRFDNPDALLTLLLALGGYATLRAVERANPHLLALAGALVGLGFLTKLGQALLVVPAFALTYLLCAPARLSRRLLHLLYALVAMVGSAGWWIAVVAAVPAADRPWIGSSTANSVLQVAFGYNGVGRLSGREGVLSNPSGIEHYGPLRLFEPWIASQGTWLLPCALVLLLTGLLLRGRAPRTDPHRAAYLMWGTWLVVGAAVLSLMNGIFHSYYTLVLMPPIAALVATGAQDAWRSRDRLGARLGLATCVVGTTLLTAVVLGRTPGWLPWLRYAVLPVGLAGAAMLLTLRGPRTDQPVRGHRGRAAACLGLVAVLAGPTAYGVATLEPPHTGPTPAAGPHPTGVFGRPPASVSGSAPVSVTAPAPPPPVVVRALTRGAGRYTWAAATVGSVAAARLQLASGVPVMPVGGYYGTDPSPTLAQFRADVAHHRIHFFTDGRRPAAGTVTSADRIRAWVHATFPVRTIAGRTFYDLTGG
jgi:4-amino-4-deoxy-L-arabinose transferase-like glycosyltransferase